MTNGRSRILNKYKEMYGTAYQSPKEKEEKEKQKRETWEEKQSRAGETVSQINEDFGNFLSSVGAGYKEDPQGSPTLYNPAIVKEYNRRMDMLSRYQDTSDEWLSARRAKLEEEIDTNTKSMMSPGFTGSYDAKDPAYWSTKNEKAQKELDEIAQIQSLREGNRTEKFYAKAEKEQKDLPEEDRKILNDLVSAKKMADHSTMMGVAVNPRPYVEKADSLTEELKAKGYSDEDIDNYVKKGTMLSNKSEVEEANAAWDEWLRSGSPAEQAAKGFFGDVMTVVGSPATAVGGLANTIDAAVGTASGKYDDENIIDTYSRTYMPQRMTEQVQGTISDEILHATENEKVNAVLNTLHSGAVAGASSAFQMALASAIASPIASIAGGAAEAANLSKGIAEVVNLTGFGASKFSSAITDAQDRGLSAEQCLQLATMQAVNEVLFEKVSLDAMWGKIMAGKAGSTAIKDVIMDSLGQAAIEGSEEVATSFADELADIIVAKDKSDYAQTVQRYQAMGRTKAEAEQLALRDFLGDVAQEFAAGVVSGGLMGGGVTKVRSAVSTNKTASELDNDTLKEVQELAKETDGAAAEIANAKNVEDMSAAEKGTMLQALYQNTEDPDNLLKEAFQEKGYSEKDAKAGAELMKETLSTDPDSMTEEEEKTIQQKIAESPVAEDFYQVQGEVYKGDIATPVNNLLNRIETTQKNKLNTAGRIQSVKEDSEGNYTFELDSGRNVKAEDLNLKPEEQKLVRFAMAADTAREATEIIKNKPADMPVQQYATAFTRIRNAAMQDIPLEIIKKTYSAYTDMMTDAQLLSIYYTGKNLASELNAKALSKENRALVDKLSKITGVNVEIGGNEGKGINGYYENGKIHISGDTINPAAVVYAHEFVHSLKAEHEDLYDRLAEEGTEFLKKNEPSVYNQIFSNRANKYQDLVNEWREKGYSQKEIDSMIDEELNAHMTEAVFEHLSKMDEEELKDFFEDLTERDRSLAEKILDFLRDLISKIKNALKGYKATSLEARKLGQDLAQLERFETTLAEVMKEAGERNAAKPQRSASENQREAASLKEGRQSIKEVPENIREIARQNIRKVADMEPVAELGNNLFEKGNVSLKDQVSEFYRKIGGKADNPLLGEVRLNRRGVKSSIAHGKMTRAKSIAFAAVPDVIEKGMVVDYQHNYEKQGHDRATIVAPIQIQSKSGEYEEYLAEVVVNRYLEDQAFYFHQAFAVKKDGEPFTKTGTLSKDEGTPGGNPSSTYNILREIAEIKRIMEEAGERNAAKPQRSTSENQREAASLKEERQSKKERTFGEEYDAWDKKDPTKTFHIGTTGYALRQIGIEEKDITFDSKKVAKIKRKHPGMTDGIIKQIPRLVEDPIVIMKSQSNSDRIVLAGELEDSDGKPVIAILELHPKDKKNLELDEIKLVSAYGKDGFQDFIDNSEILYVTADKKRTKGWRFTTGVYFPVVSPASGSTNTIRSSKGKSNQNPKIDRRNSINEAYDAQVKSADPVTYDDNGNVVPLSERFNQNDADIRFSMKELSDSGYSYDALTRLPNIAIPDVSETDFQRVPQGATNAEVLSIARDNIAEYNKGKNDYGSTALDNDYLGKVLIGREAIKHGLSRRNLITDEKRKANAYLPAYFKQAIPINEAGGKRKGADKAYILVSGFTDGDDSYIVRIIVNETNGKDGVIEDLYALRAKKEDAARRAPLRNKTSKVTSSDLNIASFLDVVKDYFPDELSTDVVKQYGVKQGKSVIDGLKYNNGAGSYGWEQKEIEDYVMKLTGERISTAFADVLVRLDDKQHVLLDEVNRIPEVKNAKQSGTSIPKTSAIPGREQNREEWIRTLKENNGFAKPGKKVYNGRARRDFKAFLVLGLPASGKSSVITDKLLKEHRAFLLDSDEAKTIIPEFNDGIGTDAVHLESKMISERILNEVLDKSSDLNGTNIVMPIIGSKEEKVRKYISLLKDAGYKVGIHLVEVDPETSVSRALKRFITGGRFINPDVIYRYGKKPSEVYEKVKGEAYEYSKWSNEVQYGERPIRIEQGSVGGLSGEMAGSGRPGRRVAGSNVGEAEESTAKRTEVQYGEKPVLLEEKSGSDPIGVVAGSGRSGRRVAGSNVGEAEESTAKRSIEEHKGNKMFSQKEIDDIDEIFEQEAERLQLKERDVIRDMLQRINHREAETLVKFSAAKKIAAELKKDYGSAIDLDNLATMLNMTFAYWMKNGQKASSEEILKTMVGISRPLIEEISEVDNSTKEVYDSLRSYLKARRVIKLSDKQKEEVRHTYGSLKEFQSRVLPYFVVSDKGSSLDSLWGELVDQSGFMLERDAEEGEQPIALYDALQALKPSAARIDFKENGMDENEMALDVALDIYGRYMKFLSDETGNQKLKEQVKKLIDQRVAYRRSVRAEYEQKLQAIRNEELAQRENKLAWFDYKLEEGKKSLAAAQEAGDSEAVRKYENSLKYYQKQRSNLVDADEAHREELRALKARYRNQNSQRRKNQEIQQKRESIKRTANRIVSMFNANTDKKHVPEALKDPVYQFITSVKFNDREDTQYGLRWVEKLRTMKDVLNDSKNADLNGYAGVYLGLMDRVGDEGQMESSLLKEIQAFIDSNANVPLGEMTLTQLEELDNIIKGLNRVINDMNRLFVNQRSERVEEIGNATIGDLKAKKDKKDHAKAIEGIEKLLNVSQLDARSYFYRLGDGAMTIYKELREGLNKRIWHIKEAQDYMQNATKGINMKDWTGNKAKIHKFNIRGQELTMTTGQIMALYESWKRNQARLHLEYGGIKPDVIDRGGKKITARRAVPLTPYDVEQITGVLTEDQKRIADAMQQYMEKECSKWGNETTMQLYGYRRYGAKNYFPIKADRNAVDTRDPSAYFGMKNQGFTKETVKNAKNALIVGDIFDIFTNHVTDMASYNAYTAPLLDAMKWFNYRNLFDEDGGFIGSVKEEMDRVYGKDMQQYFTQLIQDINGGISSGSGDLLAYNKFVSNAKAAAVGANLRVIIQQPTAYLRAAAVINPKYLIRAVGDPKMVKDSKKHSAIAQWKSWGYFETAVGQSMKSVITGNQSLKEKVVEKMMSGAQVADDLTWGALWKACLLETVDKHPTLKKGSEEFYKAAAERYDDVIDQTQVVDSALHRSQIMRSKNEMAKSLTAFMSEPTKSYNLLMNRVRDVAEKKPGAKAAVTRAAVAFAVTAVVNAAAQAIIDAFRYHDSDEYKDMDYWQRWIDRWVKNAKEGLNPLTIIPGMKDLLSVLQGSSNDQLWTQGLAKMKQGFDKMKKWFENENNYRYDHNFWDTFKPTLQGLSYLTGIPVYNLERDMEAIFETTTGLTLGGERYSNKENYDRIAEALLTDNDELYEDATEYLEEKGMEADKIESGVKSTLKQQFKDGEITEQQYKDILINEYGEDPDDVYFKIRQMNFEETHDEEEYHKWSEITDLFLSGSDAYDSLRQEMIENGVEEKTIDRGISGEIKDRYENGELTDDLYADYLRDSGKSDKEVFAEIESQNAGTEDYNVYADSVSAALAGNKNAWNQRMSELTQNGYNEEDVEKEVKKKVGAMYKTGEITESQLERFARGFLGMNDEDTLFYMEKERYEKQNGSDDGYHKWGKAAEDLLSGDRKFYVRYEDAGIEFKKIREGVNTLYQDQIKEMVANNSLTADIQAKYLDAWQLLNYKRDDKLKWIAELREAA